MKQSKIIIRLGWLTWAVITIATSTIGQAEDSPKPALTPSPPPQVQRTSAQMYIIGSTLMKEYIAAVVEQLSKNAKLPTPIIISQGSTRGVDAFCSGTGLDTPDIVAVSRQIRSTELDTCSANGVKDIVAINVGYEATVIVSRRDDGAYPLDLQSLYRAIAAELPRDYNDFVPNSYQRWSEVDPDLPNTSIRVIISAKGLGGRAFLEDRMLQAACRNIPEINTIFGADDRVKQCIAMRNDGQIVALDVPYAQNVVKTMATSPIGTLAIMPLHFAVINQESLKIQPFDGVIPSAETVSNHSYHLVRPLYFFVKKAHIKDYWGQGLVSGLREFITEVTRESTIGPNGYLTTLGLIPVEEKKRSQIRANSLQLGTMDR